MKPSSSRKTPRKRERSEGDVSVGEVMNWVRERARERPSKTPKRSPATILDTYDRQLPQKIAFAFAENGVKLLTTAQVEEKYSFNPQKLRKLGQGGQGGVYQLDEHTVIKHMLPVAKRPFEVQVLRYLREARIHKRLERTCPASIARFDDMLLDWDEQEVYHVMERIDGMALIDLIADLPEQYAAVRPNIMTYARQLIDGLVCMHREGVVHRDVKPDNVMIDTNPDDPRCYWIDFGLACMEDETESCLDRVGTLWYLAPEVIDYSREMTFETWRAADVYSLGMLIWMFLFGTLDNLPWLQIDSTGPQNFVDDAGRRSYRRTQARINRTFRDESPSLVSIPDATQKQLKKLLAVCLTGPTTERLVMWNSYVTNIGVAVPDDISSSEEDWQPSPVGPRYRSTSSSESLVPLPAPRSSQASARSPGAMFAHAGRQSSPNPLEPWLQPLVPLPASRPSQASTRSLGPVFADAVSQPHTLPLRAGSRSSQPAIFPELDLPSWPFDER